MKRVGKPVFFIVALLILAFSLTAVFGIHGQYGDIPTTQIKGLGDVRWGIDIRGGVEATYSPADDIDATDEQMNSAKSIIELRLVKNNITDYELYADYNNDRIIVRFPWKNDEENFDPESAIEELGATANLTFREGMEYETSEIGADGETIYKTPKGTTKETIILEGKDIESATPQVIQKQGSTKQEIVIGLKFTPEGTKKFAEATERLKGKTISIWMDDVMISYPTVNDVIDSGEATISGSEEKPFSAKEASALAEKINAGALPFNLKVTNYGTIDPKLGGSALYAMGIAGVIAFIIICLFMIILYRLPGLVTCIALLGQLGISIAAVSGFFNFIPSFTMTLPGIAGIILSIGMGVDANIITAERIKEEVRSGKTLDSAVDKGCRNSFWAIFDGNITVIIVAIILMCVFGPSNILSLLFGESTTGIIYSFGYTLLVGVISNFIMGVGASRLMLRSISASKFARNKWLYGGVADAEKA